MDTDKPVVMDKNKKKKKKKELYNDKDLDDQKWDKVGSSQLRKMEQREKLKQIDNYLDDLTEMAQSMGQEMKIQNGMINEVQDKMEDLDDQFKQKNRKMRKIIRQ